MKCTDKSVGSDHEIGFFNQLPPGRFLADALAEKSSQELSDEIGDVIRIQAASRVVGRFNQRTFRAASVFIVSVSTASVIFEGCAGVTRHRYMIVLAFPSRLLP